MSDIASKRKCAEEVLEKFGYEEMSEPDSPIIEASNEITIKNDKVVIFSVICDHPYVEFRKRISSSEISEEDTQKRLATLNRHLEACIKASSSRQG